MNEGNEERVADRMNEEPSIFKGCSTSELLVIVVVAAAFWLPVCLIVGLLFGAITMGLGATGVCVIATVVLGAGIFQKLKSGRPDGYYQQLFRIFLAERKIMSSPFVIRSGTWDLGRTDNASVSPRNR